MSKEKNYIEIYNEKLNKTFKMEVPEHCLYCEKCKTTNYIYSDNNSPLICNHCGEKLLKDEEANVQF